MGVLEVEDDDEEEVDVDGVEEVVSEVEAVEEALAEVEVDAVDLAGALDADVTSGSSVGIGTLGPFEMAAPGCPTLPRIELTIEAATSEACALSTPLVGAKAPTLAEDARAALTSAAVAALSSVSSAAETAAPLWRFFSFADWAFGSCDTSFICDLKELARLIGPVSS